MRRHLAILSAAVLAGLLALAALVTYRIWDQGARDEARPADAIVVLGAAQYDGRPSQILVARLSHAVDLYERGMAPLIVVTGGKREGDRTTEAAVARAYAIERGVPDSAILSEDQGRTTLESLEGVAELFREHDLGTAIVVSDRTHILRVLRIATDLGISALGSPTTTSPLETHPEWQVEATVHELGALGVYFLGGGHFIQEEADDPAR
jgi:uncharacterized SAM-binding protein YcdF (DUF218 family)